MSMVDPNNQTTYTCKVEEGSDGPLVSNLKTLLACVCVRIYTMINTLYHHSLRFALRMLLKLNCQLEQQQGFGLLSSKKQMRLDKKSRLTLFLVQNITDLPILWSLKWWRKCRALMHAPATRESTKDKWSPTYIHISTIKKNLPQLHKPRLYIKGSTMMSVSSMLVLVPIPDCWFTKKKAYINEVMFALILFFFFLIFLFYFYKHTHHIYFIIWIILENACLSMLL